MRFFPCILFLFTALEASEASGFLDQLSELIWPPTDTIQESSSSAGDVPKILYELTPQETIFLEEVLALSGTKSPADLDRCQQRVVLKLRKHCREMNEEQLGMLAVMLLNCQRQAEGRNVLECSDTMSLKDCVSSIAPEDYSSYQLMTTRAKAVCIVVGQQQYRIWAENAVNKLTNYANEQLLASDRLTEGQKHLQDLVDSTNSKIVDKEREILTLIDFIRAKSMAGVRDISRENSQWIEAHRRKIESTLREFSQFSTEISDTNTLLKSDLELLHENSLKIAEEISLANEDLLQQIEKISKQYKLTLNQLDDIEKTVEKLLKTINTWQENLNRNSEWIDQILGGINVYRGFLYVGFLFLGMIVLSFIQVNTWSRIFFVTITIANALSDLYLDVALTIPVLSSTLLCLLGGMYLIGLVSWRELFNGNAEDNVPQRVRHSVTPLRRNPPEHFFTCTAFTPQGDRCQNPNSDNGIFCQEHSIRRKYGR